MPNEDLVDVGDSLSALVFKALEETLSEQATRKFGSQNELLRSFRSKFTGKITWQEQRDGVFGQNLNIFKLNSKERNRVLFSPGKARNVYAFSGFHRFITPTFFVFSSTMKVDGTYFGVDKLGHFFNQGYQYWIMRTQKTQKGLSPKEAQRQALQWGVKSEDGVFGQVVDGVYSNADLAANFAGSQFYTNLFEPVSIGTWIKPSILELDIKTGLYQIAETVTSREILKSFISNHFDESLNPSVLERLQRGIVKRSIFHRCKRWLAFRGQPQELDLRKETDSLATWFGQPYGHRSKNTLRLDRICF